MTLLLESKIVKIYVKSFLDLLKQTMKTILRLFKLMFQFIVEFWKATIVSFKFLNNFNLRITFLNINKQLISQIRFFGMRVKNFYKQIIAPGSPVK